jgi:hypothetical protein
VDGHQGGGHIDLEGGAWGGRAQRGKGGGAGAASVGLGRGGAIGGAEGAAGRVAAAEPLRQRAAQICPRACPIARRAGGAPPLRRLAQGAPRQLEPPPPPPCRPPRPLTGERLAGGLVLRAGAGRCGGGWSNARPAQPNGGRAAPGARSRRAAGAAPPPMPRSALIVSPERKPRRTGPKPRGRGGGRGRPSRWWVGCVRGGEGGGWVRG